MQDTCYDEEDGETTRLSLQLLTMNRKELASNSWLYFDSRNQEFIGIPLEEEVGREEYQLVRTFLCHKAHTEQRMNRCGFLRFAPIKTG